MTLRQGGDLKPSSFAYASSELSAMAAAENYRRWILRYFAPHLGKRIIEVGAGMGAFSNLLLEEAQPSELILVEPADNLIPLLRQRFSGDERVTIMHGYLDRLIGAAPVDSTVLVNVLEHVEDDVEALRIIGDLLVPGGALLLLVPALPFLYGSMDRAFGHVRRYTKSSLTRKLTSAGFQILSLRYMNVLGVVPWLFRGRILNRATLRVQDVQLYDRWVVPWLSVLEGRWEPPIGQSLVAAARKPC